MKTATGTKEAGEFKRTLAVAVLEIEGGERLVEVLVLPEQLFEDLLAVVQHALRK